MKSTVWSVMLLTLGMQATKAKGETLIVAPGGSPASLYVNTKVGTTVRFPSNIMLIVPTRYFTIRKEAGRFAAIKAKSYARKEMVTIELAGGKDLHFQLIPSKRAHKYLKIQVAGKKKADRRIKLLQAMATANAVAGVTTEELDGKSVRLQGMRLTPLKAYHLPPFIGVSYSKSKKVAFDTTKTTIGSRTTKVWSADLQDQVIYIIEDKSRINPMLLGRTLRGVNP